MGLLTDMQLDSGALRNRLLSSPNGLSYWDESVGRRQFAWDTVNNRWQMVYGDTGWRDVSASLANSWTGTLLVRRIGYIVYVRATLGGTAATNNNLWSFPSGWACLTTPSTHLLAGINNALAPIFAQANSGNAAIATPDRTNSIVITGAYSTGDAWPASLPGSASGTIPFA